MIWLFVVGSLVWFAVLYLLIAWFLGLPLDGGCVCLFVVSAFVVLRVWLSMCFWCGVCSIFADLVGWCFCWWVFCDLGACDLGVVCVVVYAFVAVWFAGICGGWTLCVCWV